MRNHLFNVAEAVQRGLLPAASTVRAAVCSEEPRDGRIPRRRRAIGARWLVRPSQNC